MRALVVALACAMEILHPCGWTARAGNLLAGELPIIFDSERILLTVVGDSLEVRGTYYLYCGGHDVAPISLFYPFPEDSLLGGARMVSLRARAGDRDVGPVPWELAGFPGVRWLTPPCSQDTVILEAVYRQELRTTYARYIVTTTKSWHRALRRARFEIRLPAGAEPVEFSYPFERRKDAEGPYYAMEAAQFLPDRDITVRWKKGGLPRAPRH